MNSNNIIAGGTVGTLHVADTDEDFDREWEEALRCAPPVKSHKTRLLDMMAGWLKYAASDEFPDNPKVGDEIAALYQMAGQIPFGQMMDYEADEATHEFLTERVLRVITL